MYSSFKYKKCVRRDDKDAWGILLFLIGTLGLLMFANWLL